VIAMRDQLAHLGGAYFHQDWDLEYAKPNDVIEAFMREEEPGAVTELASEVASVLASPMDETQIADLWIGECCASYDPVDNGDTTFRGWFANVLRLLQAPQH
jgi:hypothetical protein